MEKNPYAIRSQNLGSKLRQKLIEQSTFIKDNSLLYLEIASIPLHGNGKIVTSFNGTKGRAQAIEFSSLDTVQAAIESKNKIGVLISCSHRRAGGGWLSGSLAQEESVSRSSTWAVQASSSQYQSWYSQDYKNHWLGQHGSLVIDGLFIFDNLYKKLPESKKVVFSGVAAANKLALKNDNYWDSDKGLLQRQNALIENLACSFSELSNRGVEEVIICAFGTNIFGWKLEESIKVLHRASKYCPTLLKLTCALCNEHTSQLGKDIYDNIVKNDVVSSAQLGFRK